MGWIAWIFEFILIWIILYVAISYVWNKIRNKDEEVKEEEPEC